MNLLATLFDGIIGFIQRNPITCLVVFILAVAAPAVLKGIAVFILYFILGLIVLGFVLTLLFRWKIYRLQKQMGEQFEAQGGFRQGPFSQGPFSQRPQEETEGEVKIYRTQDMPEKKVSKSVGDYVEFEETKEEK